MSKGNSLSPHNRPIGGSGHYKFRYEPVGRGGEYTACVVTQVSPRSIEPGRGGGSNSYIYPSCETWKAAQANAPTKSIDEAKKLAAANLTSAWPRLGTSGWSVDAPLIPGRHSTT